ncbi:hypothetical protein AB6A40_005522 [Gnathostoma spinigerum]|uniref:Biogenesis of lysosome-related organelles complex 1 subunit 7 n=1 Tax=Gnathostoma spinigerum TaxID=75299 RepID=A0ABD6EFU6_9BILA
MSIIGMISAFCLLQMSTAGSSPEQADGGIEMSEGIMNIVRPAIEKLDAQVHATRASQYNLNAQIQDLAQYLKDITNEQQTPYDLDMYVRKLDDSRKRIQLVGNVLQSVHERMGKLQRNIAREAYQKKQLISRAPPLPPKQ